MSSMPSQFTSLTVVYSAVYSDADQRKHISSASVAFVLGSHRDRWIPRTKGQLRGKCFHLMTSSWITLSCSSGDPVHGVWLWGQYSRDGWYLWEPQQHQRVTRHVVWGGTRSRDMSPWAASLLPTIPCMSLWQWSCQWWPGLLCAVIVPNGRPSTTRMWYLSWYQLCRHWWNWRLSLWRPTVPPETTKLALWQFMVLVVPHDCSQYYGDVTWP